QLLASGSARDVPSRAEGRRPRGRGREHGSFFVLYSVSSVSGIYSTAVRQGAHNGRDEVITLSAGAVSSIHGLKRCVSRGSAVGRTASGHGSHRRGSQSRRGGDHY